MPTIRGRGIDTLGTAVRDRTTTDLTTTIPGVDGKRTRNSSDLDGQAINGDAGVEDPRIRSVEPHVEPHSGGAPLVAGRIRVEKKTRLGQGERGDRPTSSLDRIHHRPGGPATGRSIRAGEEDRVETAGGDGRVRIVHEPPTLLDTDTTTGPGPGRGRRPAPGSRRSPLPTRHTRTRRNKPTTSGGITGRPINIRRRHRIIRTRIRHRHVSREVTSPLAVTCA